jgi:hypothetical protein
MFWVGEDQYTFAQAFKKENGFGSAFFAQYVVDDVGKSPCTLKNTCS